MSWEIEAARTSVEFSVRDRVVVNLKGRFNKVSGTIDLDEEDLTRTTISVEIDVASIYTAHERRDGVLRGPDYFDAEASPVITYKSRRIQRHGDRYRIIGDMTIKDVTREVVLDCDFLGVATDLRGRTRAGFSAVATINRQDFGVIGLAEHEADDTVRILLEVSAAKREQTVAS